MIALLTWGCLERTILCRNVPPSYHSKLIAWLVMADIACKGPVWNARVFVRCVSSVRLGLRVILCSDCKYMSLDYNCRQSFK